MPSKGIYRQVRPGREGEPTPDGQVAVQRIVRGNMALVRACREAAEKAGVSPQKLAFPPAEITPVIKEIARHYGADLVGILEMRDHHFYTHHGSDAGKAYGECVDRSLRYAVVLAVETDRDMINRAPHAEQMLATMKGYADVAAVGCKLAVYLKALGYGALLNTVIGYNAPLVPLARDAGLGQIGRHGLLITRDYGPRVRLGAVMTDLPLLSDEPVDFGLAEFCRRCDKCAANCIGDAISAGEPESVDGRPRWAFDDLACYRVWRRIGTDCGICLAACPFSQEIAPDLFDRIRDGGEAIDRVLADYEARYGKRPYIKDELPIARL
jgi:ferredoxin